MVKMSSGGVADAKKELLIDGILYDVSNWVRHHPGGKIIEFYTTPGEDATLAVQQFHRRSTARVASVMDSLPKRPSDRGEAPARHKALTDDFMELYEELGREGFFKPSLPHVLYRLLELGALVLLGAILQGPAYSGLAWCNVLSIICSALFAARCGYFSHECGHNSVTGLPKLDRFLHSAVYGLGTGLSASAWSSQHNRHHAMTQRLGHDVDLRTMPLLAFNTQAVEKPWHGKLFWIRHQVLVTCCSHNQSTD